MSWRSPSFTSHQSHTSRSSDDLLSSASVSNTAKKHHSQPSFSYRTLTVKSSLLALFCLLTIDGCSVYSDDILDGINNNAGQAGATTNGNAAGNAGAANAGAAADGGLTAGNAGDGGAGGTGGEAGSAGSTAGTGGEAGSAGSSAGTGGQAGSGGQAGTGGTGSIINAVPAAQVIADAETNKKQINVIGGRDGYFYAFQSKTAGAVFRPTPPSEDYWEADHDDSPDPGYAYHLIATNVGPVTADAKNCYAGSGFTFRDADAAYDASGKSYDGIRLWLKVGTTHPNVGVRPAPISVELKFGASLTAATVTSPPKWGITGAELSTEWQEFVFPFAQLSPAPDLKQLRGLQFKVAQYETGCNVGMDIYVDYIHFYKASDLTP